MVGVIWYRFVRYSGTDWSATLVPIGAMRWYRFIRYSGTDSPILSSMRIPSAIEIESILWASMRFCHVWAIPGWRKRSIPTH